MSQIKYSILIPVYNVDKYLNQCLDSVLNQTYKNFEIILIDDGSRDSSGKICDDYGKVDKRIKVYHQKNKGLARTRYEGMKKINGLFTLFLDSDDYWEENLLESLNKIIDKDNPDLVIFNYRQVSENNEILFDNLSILKNKKIYTKDNKLEIYNQIFFTDKISAIWRKVVKSSLINLEDYERYLDIENGEDNMFSIPLLIKADRIINIDRILYNYRFNSTSITNNLKKNKIKDEYIRKEYSLFYLKKLELDTRENLEKLNNMYVYNILVYIFKLGNTDIKMKEKINILNEIKEFYLKGNEVKIKNVGNKKTYIKILSFLYKFEIKRTIFIYSCLIKKLVGLKKLIKKGANK